MTSMIVSWAWWVVICVGGALVLGSIVRTIFHRQELTRDRADEVRRHNDVLYARDSSMAGLARSELDSDARTWVGGTARYLALRAVEGPERPPVVVPSAADIIARARRVNPYTVVSDGPTSIRLPLVIEGKTVPRRRLMSATDDLGTWEPWAYELAEPRILGAVLAWRKWATLRPEHVGMGAL